MKQKSKRLAGHAVPKRLELLTHLCSLTCKNPNFKNSSQLNRDLSALIVAVGINPEHLAVCTAKLKKEKRLKRRKTTYCREVS